VYSGIVTLLDGATVKTASAHQGTALVAVSVALFTAHSFRKPSKQYLTFA